MGDWLFILAILCLLFASAFLSGSESALTASSRARLLFQERAGSRGARRVNRLLSDRDRVIGSILVGNNLFNTLATSLAAGLLVVRVGEEGILLATVIMTILISFFGEVLPKLYALQEPERNARRAAGALSLLSATLRPVVGVIYGLARFLLRPTLRRGASRSAGARAQELRGAIEAYGAGDERHMLRSVLDLDEITVADVMVHRSEVRSLRADESGASLLRAALEIPHSRLPVWSGRPDNIVGILHVKDLFRAVRASARAGEAESADLPDFEGIDLRDADFSALTARGLARAPWFAPESTSLLHQLRAFRSRRAHLAVVVDEYGELQGIVTLEDILEEIVGEIFDEEDESKSPAGRVLGDSVVVEGRAALRDLNRRFGWSLPDEEASTLGGLILYETRRIPEVGERLRLFGFEVRILERDGQSLVAVELRPPASGSVV